MIVTTSGNPYENLPTRHHRQSVPIFIALAFVAACWGFNPARAAAQDPDNPAVEVSVDVPGGEPEVEVDDEDVEVEGELDVLYEDDERRGKLHHFLNDNGRRIPLHFRKSNEPDLPSGTRIQVKGKKKRDSNLAEGGVTPVSVTVTSGTTSRTMGNQYALVILFNFSNNAAQPYSPADAASVTSQVRDFYLENSFGQTVMNFTVTGWLTIPATNAGCDYYTWATQAETAASNAGYNLNAYDRRILAFPSGSGCTWWGMGNLAGPRSWVNGNFALRVVAHEQGHNFGNHHSHSMPCDAGNCGSVEYGDDRDILGAPGTIGHMGAFQKERLGWLDYGSSPTIQTVTSTGDYWIQNYEVLSGDPRALRIWNSKTSTYYYIESRAKTGFDAGVPSGVTLHTGSPTVSNSSYQVDLRPESSEWDSTLDVGQVFTDSAIGVEIQTLSTGLDGALIRVIFGGGAPVPAPAPAPAPAPVPAPAPAPVPAPATCTLVAPSVSLSTTAQFKYTVTVKDNRSAGCTATTISLSASGASGWAASFSPASFSSVTPGATVSSGLTLIAPTGASGSFSFSVSATDAYSGYISTASGSVTLSQVSSLEVSTNISMTLDRKGNNKSVTITPNVKSGQAAVAAANVQVALSNPNGGSWHFFGTTGTDGTTSFNYQIKPKDPSGTYQVKTTATKDGVTSVSTTSFVVQ
jgi:hypothetical protein